MSLLADLLARKHVRTLDHAFAQSLRRLQPDTPDAVLLAAALASLAVANGHAGFDPLRPHLLVDADLAWPAAEDWIAQLRASPWIAQPGDALAPSATDAPLAFEHGLLYLRRYREYEARLAAGLTRIAAQTMPAVESAALGDLFATLFPHAATGQDRQAWAAALALRRALLLVTGGPGTGKTTTIARLLLLRIAHAHAAGQPMPRIALAAPTGRAAERMADSLQQAVARAMDQGLPPLSAYPVATTAPHPGSSPLPLAGEGARRAGEGSAPPTDPTQPSTTPHPGSAPLPQAGEGARRAGEGSAPLADPTQPSTAPHPGSSPLPLAGEGARRAGEGSAPNDPSWNSALPTGASTLHRLLGVIPDSPQFRHTADNPLPFELIVVDEASMVDLPLMCKLVDAVADGTQLILLGDADQLPSVEAGDVLAAILQAAGPGDALQPGDASALQPLLGSAPAVSPPPAADTGCLTGHRVHLLRGYRQADDFALAPLADAVRAGDADTALALLRSGELPGVHFHEHGEDPLALGSDALLAHWRALADASDPADALRAAGRLRLLTAVRAGPQGVRGLNARIEQLLAETGVGARRLGSGSPWFHGRLLLITENSYRHGLFNGDVGICLRSEASPFPGRSAANPSSDQSDAITLMARGNQALPSSPSQDRTNAHRDTPATDSRAQGPLVAWFAGDGDGQVRGFHPAALPAHESAFAMTVHKAQGSEFDSVWLQLPTRDARVLSRELLYTGITRARRALHLAGNEAVIRAALARHASRISGLAWRLGAQQQAEPVTQAREQSTAVPVQGSLF
ncbi:AAA family ATPase [Xanthomonas sp. NCPPB 1067]|uniref:AAA family ATPase n=1 Tax=Xanthomonas TaxID=338 RepID=UPI001E57C8ED|nr:MULTISPECIES: AAA family ATPase [Xanthomonas]MCC4588941.1 AAA family ATPase [Xanthomonas sp. NCPPB 1067]MCD0258135.1 AAA family ATPase [Xanthomonas melonis]